MRAHVVRRAIRSFVGDFKDTYDGLRLETWFSSHCPTAHVKKYPGTEGDDRRMAAERQDGVADCFWDVHLAACGCAGTECGGPDAHVTAGAMLANAFDVPVDAVVVGLSTVRLLLLLGCLAWEDQK